MEQQVELISASRKTIKETIFFSPPYRNENFSDKADRSWNNDNLVPALSIEKLIRAKKTSFENILNELGFLRFCMAFKLNPNAISKKDITQNEYLVLAYHVGAFSPFGQRYDNFKPFGLSRIRLSATNHTTDFIGEISNWLIREDGSLPLYTDINNEPPYNNYKPLILDNLASSYGINKKKSFTIDVEYNNIKLTTIPYSRFFDTIKLTHTSSKNITKFLQEYTKPLYSKIVNTKYQDINNLLKDMATLVWQLSHLCVFFRGSAAITQILLFSLMVFHGLEPIKYDSKNMLDLEALSLKLDDFIARFSNNLKFNVISGSFTNLTVTISKPVPTNPFRLFTKLDTQINKKPDPMQTLATYQPGAWFSHQ